MPKKQRAMRLEPEVWDELERVGRLVDMDRTALVRAMSKNALKQIKTAKQAARFLYQERRDRTVAAKNPVAENVSA